MPIPGRGGTQNRQTLLQVSDSLSRFPPLSVYLPGNLGRMSVESPLKVNLDPCSKVLSEKNRPSAPPKNESEREFFGFMSPERRKSPRVHSGKVSQYSRKCRSRSNETGRKRTYR